LAQSAGKASNCGSGDELIARGLGAGELPLFGVRVAAVLSWIARSKRGDDPEVLAGSSLTIGLSRVEVGMWERISAVDIEDAKAQLSRKRGETLSRQAE